MSVTCQEGLSGKQSFINRSVTGVRGSGSCLQSEVLMASPTPCIVISSFAFPLQKNVHSPVGSAIEPSSASLVSLRAAMSVWYLPSSLAMRAVLLSGLEERGSNTNLLAYAFSLSHNTMPPYLSDLLHPYQPPRTLRSLDTSLLSVPRFCL